MKEVINTQKAPEAIGTYSQAVRFADVLYISGQIPLDPVTMTLVNDSIEAEVNQVFDNLSAICQAASGSLAQVLKLTIYLLDLSAISIVNQAMARYFVAPYPARVALGVAALPRGARIEIDAIMACNNKE